MENNGATYEVQGMGFNSFMDAVNYARTIDADVIQVSNGMRRWTPAPKNNRKRVEHVLVKADGSVVPLTRRNANAK